MKVLVVISKINFLPTNGYDFLNSLIKNNGKDVCGVLILQNRVIDKIPQIFKLYLSGCKKWSKNYLRNIIELPFHRREHMCSENNIEVIKAISVNDNSVIKWVKKNKIDLIINNRTTCIYKKIILSLPNFGCINVHHGILPKYRGRYCDLYALYEKRRTGFSVHKMTERVDSGEIYFKKYVSKHKENDYFNYLKRLPFEESRIINLLLKRIKKESGLSNGQVNKSSKYIYTKNPDKNDLRLMLKSGLIL
jgi:methionyl-tRNA formyltransferase